MGIWPFGKKNEDAKKEQAQPAAKGEKPAGPESVDKDAQESYPPEKIPQPMPRPLLAMNHANLPMTLSTVRPAPLMVTP